MPACSYGRRNDGFTFQVSANDGVARTGVIKTARGEIRTPAFIADRHRRNRQGDVAGKRTPNGADIILGNTYHLMLRPGAERVAKLAASTSS